MSNNTSTNNEHLFTVTGFSEDGDRVALAGGGDVLLWLTLEGVELARKGAVDTLHTRSFPEVATLLQSYIDNGGQIGVCPPCAKAAGLADDELVANASWMGGAAVIDATRQRDTPGF